MELAAGLRVEIHSLQTLELNGSVGTVVGYIEAKGRHAVDVDGNRLLLKPQNLQPAPPTEATVQLAVQRLREHQLGQGGSSDDDLSPDGLFAGASTSQDMEHLMLADTRVWCVTSVFSARECDQILVAVQAAGERRGWDRLRHGQYRTTDLPIELVPAVEAHVRAVIFRKVLRLFARTYLGRGFLPEHLSLNDCFYVKYSAVEGQQRALKMHADGSLFSFNLLLSDPGGFSGGGTYFEATAHTSRPPRGAALAHNGHLRHCGMEITAGERYLLVGFVGCAPAEAHYSVREAGRAAHEAARKFGTGAWDRSALVAAELEPGSGLGREEGIGCTPRGPV